MVNAVSNSVVPKSLLLWEIPMVLEIMRCGKHTTQSSLECWISRYGRNTSRKVLAQIEASSLKKSGEIVDEAKRKRCLTK
jgi:hypothetical protein